ncbi:hypothetical protein ACFVZ3_07060 [Kitasatospora purpeofusca]|uniref:hypothetical protein n=1 Tax=Kitasatospora purpeofusca TaxID=67352 RepID=UPI0036A35FDD
MGVENGVAGRVDRVRNELAGSTVHGHVVQAGDAHITVNLPGPPGAAVPRGPLGRPIGGWDPHDLEVHPADVAGTARVLPGYVRRRHDEVAAEVVRDAAAGRSGLLVLVGSSSTGKTRACWEAVQPLAAEGWRLWHPFDPTRAEAALADLEHVGPRTVVWLNEAQHYLGHPREGERIAAALHTLLTRPERGPVLVLGTLWPEYEAQYTALPRASGPDPHSRVRELLAGRTVTVPDAFDERALRDADALAASGDRLMADALVRARSHGRVAQDLAGALELLRRYERGTPAVRALLEAATDARRLGVGLHLPQAFLVDAAADYFGDRDWDRLADDWAEAAFADLGRPVHGKEAPLGRTSPRPVRRPPGTPAPAAPPTAAAGPLFRLADYLEQHGRTARRRLCPPASFWQSALAHLTDPGDLGALASAAEGRHRLQWAHHLRLRAADSGDPDALMELGRSLEEAGDGAAAEVLAWQAAEAGNLRAVIELGHMRDEIGDRKGAAALYRQAAAAGHPVAVTDLAWLREQDGDQEGAEALYLRGAAEGDDYCLIQLTRRRAAAGDLVGAEEFARRSAADGEFDALIELAELLEKSGDLVGAEALHRRAVGAGHTYALLHLGEIREKAGDPEGAEACYREAVGAGHTFGFTALMRMREGSGDREGAEDLARLAADAGNVYTLTELVRSREEAGDRTSAEALCVWAAARGHDQVLSDLVRMREEAGDRATAEAFAWQAADAGLFSVAGTLAYLWERAGDRAAAEALRRRLTDAGGAAYVATTTWPHGLDPDGSPSAPWR